ncbi:calcium/sodium antiporter [Jannaschia sp. S6380]|uniref:calcium/sodium antiporter n=1 Tax=Jannaschia sp. S6380 TaxID=2926408 RepID=UPI001FF518B3|nr:calcium/sodium antiporter [Jannaschia sp. S6380]MCK0169221.1 calcium/sodium antiporter [Jannaschia sp. S6380]
MDILLVLAGLAALLVGGGLLVSGAVDLARRWGLPPLVIGVTLVGMGTSLPELLTSLRAAQTGAPGLALGNVVGSNVANILLILSVAALLSPVAMPRRVWRGDGIVLLGISVAGALWLGLAGGLGLLGAVAFLAVFAVWMAWQLRQSDPDPDLDAAPPMSALGAGLLVGLGFAGVLLGAEMLVRGAVSLARLWGVSEAVIGLTIVAVGTSLPELATSAMAAWKGRSEIALGNVLGSNVFNLLFILGVTGLFAPLPADARFAVLDIPVMVGAVVLLLAVAYRGRIGRAGAAIMLAGYGAYIWVLTA